MCGLFASAGLDRAPAIIPAMDSLQSCNVMAGSTISYAVVCYIFNMTTTWTMIR